MTPGNLIPQNLSGELDGGAPVSDHGNSRRHIAEDRYDDSGVANEPYDSHLAVARVLEEGACHVNVLDVHGFHQFQIAHSKLPKRANHLHGNLGKCGALAASEFDNLPQSYAVSFSEHMTFVEIMSSAKNNEVHLTAVSTVNPSESFRVAATTARTASRPNSAPRLQQSLAG